MISPLSNGHAFTPDQCKRLHCGECSKYCAVCGIAATAHTPDLPAATASRATDVDERYTAYTFDGETRIPLGDNLSHAEVIELCRYRAGVVVDLIEN